MKKQYVLLSLLSLWSCASLTADSYSWKFYNGHIYALTNTVGTWEECETEASLLGGHLVTINDATENIFLQSLFSGTQGYLTAWIGLYQDKNDPEYQEPDKGWKWSSGEPVTHLGWAPPEPTNSPPGEDYTLLEITDGTFRHGPEYGWNDTGYERHDYQPTRGVIELDLSALEYDWFIYNNHAYALTYSQDNWENCEAEAVVIGGHLVTINNAEENIFLESMFSGSEGTNNVWIGLYQDKADPEYQEPDKGWKWVSGKSVNYTGWAPPEPTNSEPSEDYAIIEMTDGIFRHSSETGWNDIGYERHDYKPARGIIEVIPICNNPALIADLNDDCIVNLEDLLILSAEFLTCHGFYPETFCGDIE